MLETGTPRIAAIGWGAAVEWLDRHDMKEIHSHINRIASWTAEQISNIDGITVYGDPARGDSSKQSPSPRINTVPDLPTVGRGWIRS